MKTSEIMTAKQLAEYLQMSQITVCRLAREKKLPGLKIGKEWRFQKELIDKLIASGSNFDQVLDGNYSGFIADEASQDASGGK